MMFFRYYLFLVLFLFETGPLSSLEQAGSRNLHVSTLLALGLQLHATIPTISGDRTQVFMLVRQDPTPISDSLCVAWFLLCRSGWL